MELNQSENMTNIMKQLIILKESCNELIKKINHTENNINKNNINKNNINKNNINKNNLMYYRGFIITQETCNINKMKIDKFYEDFKNNIENQSNDINDNQERKIYERFKNVSTEQIFTILDTLIQNNDIYKSCENNMDQIKDENIVEKNIIQFTKNLFVLGIQRLIKNVSGEPQNRIYQINIIYKYLIKYEYFIKSKIFSELFKKFYATTLNKCIEFSSESGEIGSWLTFAHFCPEMITPDCYPYINFESSYHISNDENLKNNFQNYEKYKDYIVIDKHTYKFKNNDDDDYDYGCDCDRTYNVCDYDEYNNRYGYDNNYDYDCDYDIDYCCPYHDYGCDNNQCENIDIDD
jgi:hypothetical protein